MMKEVHENHEKFVAETGGSKVGGNAREEMMKNLAAAHDAFFELRGNLQEGTKFYNDLTQLLVTFQNKVSDFCFARKTEKDELMKDLSSAMASMTVSAAPTPPSHHAPPSAGGSEPERPPRKNDAPGRPPQPAVNPYAGAPAAAAAPPAPIEPARTAPPAPTAAPPPNPYAGAPTGGAAAHTAPYPPPGYAPYTPMPVGYNPYGTAVPGYPPATPGYPAPYPGHYPPAGYPGYPPPAGYPAYPPQQPPTSGQQPWPGHPPQQQ